MGNFYVYEYFIVDSNEVFYVGKGTGRRYKELHNRNKYFNAIITKYQCDVRFVQTNISNEQAIDLEIKRIAELRSKGQAKANLTEGGDGFSSGLLNPTYRVSHKGELNPFYGKRHTEETKQKISKGLKGRAGLRGSSNPMYGVRRTGSDNPMYGKTGTMHHNAVKYQIIYTDGTSEIMHYKGCDSKFGIAFRKIYKTGGILCYLKKCKRSKYEGTEIIRLN